MNPERFRELVTGITGRSAGKPLDPQLEAELNRSFPAGGPEYGALFDACRAAIAAGWMCAREAGGIRYGRVIKPDAGTGGFSVDVVDMDAMQGPHHRHPNGEIDLIMPLTEHARFDGRGAGWLVYRPDSAPTPAGGGGRALGLYPRPGGAGGVTPP